MTYGPEVSVRSWLTSVDWENERSTFLPSPKVYREQLW